MLQFLIDGHHAVVMVATVERKHHFRQRLCIVGVDDDGRRFWFLVTVDVDPSLVKIRKRLPKMR